MLKDRQFVIGLGIGLIIAACFLQVIQAMAEEQSPKRSIVEQGNNSQVWTEKDVKAKASELNMVAVPQSDWDRLSARANEPKASDTKLPTPAPVESASQTPSPTLMTDSASIQSSNYINIYISEGMTSSAIAVLLAQSLIIPERTVFEQEIKDRQLESKIRSGPYAFKINDSIDNVIERITIKSK